MGVSTTPNRMIMNLSKEFLASSCIKHRIRLVKRCFALSATSNRSHPPTIAIRREDSSVWERRAPLNPAHVNQLVRDGVRVLVQPSSRRAYLMPEYERSGAVITDEIEDADVIMGIKKPPIELLIPNKTYAFFSHTIKAQEENMPLLDAVLEKGVRLVDYERLVNAQGQRLVAFGQYAGIAGMINILHGLGLRLLALGHHTPFMHIAYAHNYSSSSAAKAAIATAGREIQYGLMPKDLGPLIFTFTGAGNVSQGAQDIFNVFPHEYVSPVDLRSVVETGDTHRLYGTVVDMEHHLVRKDGTAFDFTDYATNPQDYESTFAEKVAPFTTCLVNGVYWAPGTPRLLTKEQCKLLMPKEYQVDPSVGVPKLPQRLLAIADISADPQGSIEFMSVYTNIDSPFVLYNAHTDTNQWSSLSGNGIVMSVIDNLPAQLPREATDYFSSRLNPFINDFLQLDGNRPLKEQVHIHPAVRGAVITFNHSLTSEYEYINELRRSKK